MGAQLENGTGEYLLIKRGLYYRPGDHGYTGIKSEAGRYHESDAYPDGGVTAIHQDDAPLFSPACWDDVKIKYLLSLIGERDAMLQRVSDWINDHVEVPTHGATRMMIDIRDLLAKEPTP